MSEYAERFAENKIDVSVLRHLTDQDLKEIGVPLGHRRKMLAAIGELGRDRPRKACSLLHRAEAPRHRRAPPSHSDVLGPRRFDGTLGPHGPGGLISLRSRRRAHRLGDAFLISRIPSMDNRKVNPLFRMGSGQGQLWARRMSRLAGNGQSVAVLCGGKVRRNIIAEQRNLASKDVIGDHPAGVDDVLQIAQQRRDASGV